MLKGHPTSMRRLKLMDALYLAYSRSSSPHWPVPGIHLLLELGIERSLWPLLVLSRASLSRCSESNSGLAMACEKNQNKLINERMWWGFRLFFNFHLPPSIPLPTETLNILVRFETIVPWFLIYQSKWSTQDQTQKTRCNFEWTLAKSQRRISL